MAWPYPKAERKVLDLRQRRLLVAEVLRTLPTRAPEASPRAAIETKAKDDDDVVPGEPEHSEIAEQLEKEKVEEPADGQSPIDLLGLDEPEAEALPESPASRGVGPFQGKTAPPPLLPCSIMDPHRQGSTPARLVWLSNEVLRSTCGNVQELVDVVASAKADAVLAIDTQHLSFRRRGLGRRLGLLARKYISAPPPPAGLQSPTEDPDYFEEALPKALPTKSTIIETLCSLQMDLTEVEHKLKDTAHSLGFVDQSFGRSRSRVTWLANQSGSQRRSERETVASRYAPVLHKLRAVEAISSSQTDLGDRRWSAGRQNGRRFAFATRDSRGQ